MSSWCWPDVNKINTMQAVKSKGKAGNCSIKVCHLSFMRHLAMSKIQRQNLYVVLQTYVILNSETDFFFAL